MGGKVFEGRLASRMCYSNNFSLQNFDNAMLSLLLLKNSYYKYVAMLEFKFNVHAFLCAS